MSISFKIRFRDFLWFTHYCLIREVRDTTLFILILCVCALFGVSAFGPQSVKAFVHFEILKFVAIAAISCVIGVFLFTLVVYYLVGVFSPTGTSVSQKQLIALTDDNILVHSPRTQMKITWDEIRRLTRTKHYLIVHFRQFGALIIPRRAFQNDSKWHVFYVYCQQKSRASRA